MCINFVIRNTKSLHKKKIKICTDNSLDGTIPQKILEIHFKQLMSKTGNIFLFHNILGFNKMVKKKAMKIKLNS